MLSLRPFYEGNHSVYLPFLPARFGARVKDFRLGNVDCYCLFIQYVVPFFGYFVTGF